LVISNPLIGELSFKN
jgi:hypothetical protein